MDEIKTAMKAKDTVALESLRAIKSAILLAQTESGAKEELSAEEEIKLLQRLVKQRKDSANIYIEQNRQDLADPELAQVAVIEKFLPAQLGEEEVEVIVRRIIAENNFSGMADMGKVMGIASKELAGSADGKTIQPVFGSLFFGAANRLDNLMDRFPTPPRVFILRMGQVPFVDASGVHALHALAERCRRQGIVLVVSGLQPQPTEVLDRMHLPHAGLVHRVPDFPAALALARTLAAPPGMG